MKRFLAFSQRLCNWNSESSFVFVNGKNIELTHLGKNLLTCQFNGVVLCAARCSDATSCIALERWHSDSCCRTGSISVSGGLVCKSTQSYRLPFDGRQDCSTTKTLLFPKVLKRWSTRLWKPMAMLVFGQQMYRTRRLSRERSEACMSTLGGWMYSLTTPGSLAPRIQRIESSSATGKGSSGATSPARSCAPSTQSPTCATRPRQHHQPQTGGGPWQLYCHGTQPIVKMGRQVLRQILPAVPNADSGSTSGSFIRLSASCVGVSQIGRLCDVFGDRIKTGVNEAFIDA